jgi:hypothetical protein
MSTKAFLKMVNNLLHLYLTIALTGAKPEKLVEIFAVQDYKY